MRKILPTMPVTWRLHWLNNQPRLFLILFIDCNFSFLFFPSPCPLLSTLVGHVVGCHILLYYLFVISHACSLINNNYYNAARVYFWCIGSTKGNRFNSLLSGSTVFLRTPSSAYHSTLFWLPCSLDSSYNIQSTRPRKQ